ncbi:MAG: radical SAM protein [Candidatus Thermoplasmatota archaeon]|nr:radical SAM protein [Candidatus Thermoplasmatota archaeon]
MEVVYEQGHEDLAKVYVAVMRGSNEYMVEFAESLQPPLLKAQKWVLIISCLFGCPVKCLMCDASTTYRGKLTAQEMIEQIDYLVAKYFSDRKIPIPKFKIQFARMGEPALNNNVLEVLEKLPKLYNAPGLMPAISTLAPKGCNDFFERLIEIKNRYYSGGFFQLQFSIHTTNPAKRDKLMPVNKWNLKDISEYGEKFVEPQDRKITLNFAVTEGYEVVPEVIRRYFNPKKFAIKLTPLNPTEKVCENKLTSSIDANRPETASQLINEFKACGFDVILSIGELEENKIGSNCGFYLSRKIH